MLGQVFADILNIKINYDHRENIYNCFNWKVLLRQEWGVIGSYLDWKRC